MKLQSLFLLAFTLALIVPYAQANEKHALLIGIAEYPYLGAIQQLEGPVNDVESLKTLLISQQGFSVLKM
ncbi:MAG TPA: caspase family protein [Thermodesulfovibrionia bacterium]|nr:caspase family protein [Thermodesulfovibrionia bacterium]